ncbi:MAG: DUF2075 domain-containing protein [Halobacteriota archaeon]
MKRSYFDVRLGNLAQIDPMTILGVLTRELPFPTDPLQRKAWLYQIDHVKGLSRAFPDAHVFFEFSIPRMGRRADVVLLIAGLIFVIEYKVGATKHYRADIDQTVGYAIDLASFHETSHDVPIIPILVATDSHDSNTPTAAPTNNVYPIVLTDSIGLANVLSFFKSRVTSTTVDPKQWLAGRYKPTPTIVEAAQVLYREHTVEAISQHEAATDSLTRTHRYIEQVIIDSQHQQKKSICFLTGVPGSGKTLAGLNIAAARADLHGDGHAVFLSGNGPLVIVLREALTQDRLEQQKQRADIVQKSKVDIEAGTHAFVQNIHHFRNEYVDSEAAPTDRIVIFDESQRAWNKAQATRFMQKRGHPTFDMSEPEFLLSVMNRHKGWATVVCLVGGGQEINTGEAGISEWLRALKANFSSWVVHISNQLLGEEYITEKDAELLAAPNIVSAPELHLQVSRRSFRAEALSNFVSALIRNDIPTAHTLKQELSQYPIYRTRSLQKARNWLRAQRRGQERTGLLASSNALRLKKDGIFVKSAIDPAKWFLASPYDVRSSCALEDAASEFDVQGLELDWACVCWDANLRREANGWAGYTFSGTTWKKCGEGDRTTFLFNSYRVLLTRARQGMVIFVPHGDVDDPTRLPSLYDPIYEFLSSLGIPELPPPSPFNPGKELLGELERQT